MTDADKRRQDLGDLLHHARARSVFPVSGRVGALPYAGWLFWRGEMSARAGLSGGGRNQERCRSGTLCGVDGAGMVGGNGGAC